MHELSRTRDQAPCHSIPRNQGPGFVFDGENASKGRPVRAEKGLQFPSINKRRLEIVTPNTVLHPAT
jgi:hypothetical protein